MEKKSVLFVDDEPNILEGLRRMLRSLRNQYDMHFAGGGREALDLMAVNRFDVVVSDMRMPGMDGAELLEAIQEKYPHTIRMMLTGQADEQSIFRTVGVVHQFLAKPCDPEFLKSILIQTAALQDILSDGGIKNLISQIGSLPSLPATYDKLRKAMSAPEADVNLVGKIIEQDMAMSAKVLQLVNSAFFGIYVKVETPTRAVKLLGLDTIKVLVLGLAVFSEMKNPTSVLPLEILWSHSLAVGKISKAIAVHENLSSELISDVFLAGTLHDIGKLILISQLPEKYQLAIDEAWEKNISLPDAEYNVFGARQGAVGAYLLGLWGFSSSIIETICFQSEIGKYPSSTITPALIVHAANVLYYRHTPEDIIGKRIELNLQVLEELGLQNRVEEWDLLCAEIIQSLEEGTSGD